MPVLSRFGRVFSAGFYAFLGVVSAQTVSSVRQDSSFSSEVSLIIYKTKININIQINLLINL